MKQFVIAPFVLENATGIYTRKVAKATQRAVSININMTIDRRALSSFWR